MAARKFRRLALGGTFDILHVGHKKTLREAFKLSEKVLIGISDDDLVKEINKKYEANSLGKRKAMLVEFLRVEGLLSAAKLIPIRERFGVTPTSIELEALMVSRENSNFAREINRLRKKKGLGKLKVVVFDKLKAEDGLPISSTRIRLGEIDKDGYILKKKALL